MSVTAADTASVADQKIWWNIPDDSHSWAFIFFCQRQGDKVTVFGRSGGIMNVSVRRNSE